MSRLIGTSIFKRKNEYLQISEYATTDKSILTKLEMVLATHFIVSEILETGYSTRIKCRPGLSFIRNCLEKSFGAWKDNHKYLQNECRLHLANISLSTNFG